MKGLLWAVGLSGLWVVLLAACGQAPSSVGRACTTNSDCDASQVCYLSAPGGFCSRGCTNEGSVTECPSGTVCTYEGGTQLLCAPICTSNMPCRAEYSCALVKGSNYKACIPSPKP